MEINDAEDNLPVRLIEVGKFIKTPELDFENPIYVEKKSNMKKSGPRKYSDDKKRKKSIMKGSNTEFSKNLV